MKRSRNRGLGIMLILALMLALMPACQKGSEKSEGKGPTSVRVLTDAEFQATLHAHRGHVLVVNFFTTWCEPCRKEMPHFIDLSRFLKVKGVDFIGVSLDTSGKKVLRTFLKRVQIPYPVYLADVSLRNKLNIQAVPTTYIYDREGKRVVILQGGVSRKTLLKRIQEVL